MNRSPLEKHTLARARGGTDSSHSVFQFFRLPTLARASAAVSAAVLAASALIARADTLLTDNFTATGNPNTADLNYNLASRQGGTEATKSWTPGGNAQVGNPTGVGQPAGTNGDYLLLAHGANATLGGMPLSTANVPGPLTISFDVFPGIQGPSDTWTSFRLGATAGQGFPVAGSGELGFLYRQNTGIQVFNNGGAFLTLGSTSGGTNFSFTFTDTGGTGSPFAGNGTKVKIMNGANDLGTYTLNTGMGTRYLSFMANGDHIGGIDNLSVVADAAPTADMASFSILGIPGTINQAAPATVSLTMPYGTDVTALVPTIAVLPAGATVTPASGVAQNFTNPVAYQVQNGATTKNYTVTVNVTPASTACDMLTMNWGAYTGVINQLDQTVTLYVPSGTNVTTLNPTYTVSQFASQDATYPTGTARNFTTPQTYTVTAQNGATKTYTVSVNISAWSYAPWTGDADSGISATHTYTAAVNCPAGAVTVNGVPFQAWVESGANFSFGGAFAGITGQTPNITGNSLTLASSFVFNGNPRTVTLTNLTPGVQYESTFFAFGWEASGRVQTFSAGADSLPIDQDAYGNGNGIRISHVFTADASGTKTFSIAPGAGGSFHMSAFANRTTVDTYQEWLAANGKTDTPENYREYAFGTTNTGAISIDPVVVLGQAPAMQIGGGATVPVTAIFGRRKNYQQVGLTYTVQFSPDLANWYASDDPALRYAPGASTTPVQVAQSGEMDVVGIAYPHFIKIGDDYVRTGGQGFVRILVTSN